MTRTELLAVVDDRPMTNFQVTVVALCCLINMLDGFDILAIAFTGARIAAETQFDARVQGSSTPPDRWGWPLAPS